MRKVIEMLKAEATSDGAGVKLMRVFGGRGAERFDPFLMLDEFGSFEAADYLGGFPAHPHRGFETITYMLEGKMEHRDHLQNVGLLNDGDVQWMTAARGIIHSEMPRQTEGRMRGFQLWLNLPAADKMNPASYRDVAAGDIPEFRLSEARVKAIAGEGKLNEQVISGLFVGSQTEPVLWDIGLLDGQSVAIRLPDQHNAMIYVYEGKVDIGGTPVKQQHLVRLGGAEPIALRALDPDSKVLLIAGKPLNEPIVQYGPFVMNSAAEIERALQDYRDGTLTA